MISTQDLIPISDIKDNLLILKNGDIGLVLETSAVNFGLLNPNEQYAIIASFAGLLNSLSFPIQIVVRSKRFDISDYLKNLDAAYQKQKNPLLANMMIRYRKFVELTVKENEVLDKQFFVVISLAYYQLGLTRTSQPDLTRAMTMLLPKRDHIIRQLSRIGLRASQLSTRQLIQLFYDIYNYDPNRPLESFEEAAEIKQMYEPRRDAETARQNSLQNAERDRTPLKQDAGQVESSGSEPESARGGAGRVAFSSPAQPLTAPEGVGSYSLAGGSNVAPTTGVDGSSQSGRRGFSPFVVEELKDDYDGGVS